jgi:hypothetical protein
MSSIDKYIAPFNNRSAYLHNLMQDRPEFKKACIEFAHAFNLQMAVAPISDDDKVAFNAQPVVGMYTHNFIYVGALLHMKDYRKGGHFFEFQSERLIKKDRKSSRSSATSRDAVKISSIISALKKNNEAPTEGRMIDRIKGGLRFAFIALSTSSESEKDYNLNRSQIGSLLELYMEGDKHSANAYHSVFEEKYRQHQKAKESEKARLALIQRFYDGCTAIKVETTQDYRKPVYLVGDVSCTRRNPSNSDISLTNVVGYETLAGTPYAGFAAMLRSYMEGNPHHSDANELGISTVDKYIPEMDISIGYDIRDHGSWVLIPKQHAE